MNQDKVPKYYLLKKILIEKIEMEEFKSNVPILSERELMEQFQVSRITVRKAIDELVKEGYLYKIQGKGTYVKNDDYNQDLFEITSCTEEILKLGKKPKKLVIISDVIKADIKRAKILNITTDDMVFRLGRVNFADDEPINYTLTYLPRKIFLDIEKNNFEEESLYNLIEEKYNIKILKARRTIEAVLAKDAIAEYLDIDEGMPIILFGCTTYGLVNGKEVPIETFKCYYRTDKFKFYINQIK